MKAHSSLLGFRVKDRDELASVLATIRASISRFADPFKVILSYADLPDEIAAADGTKCIAEEIISQGRQCTLEGYSFQGNIKVYGIVDSIHDRNRCSLERYEYPSSLPKRIRERMTRSACAVIEAVGLDDSPFNMEFFYREADDFISLLEINARISKSHSPLFDKVEGVPHNEVMIDIALGRRPDYPVR
ncbi:ATP-grasp domain-containing protein [Breoghania sp.]|uniref:ATP-grasp domain-containing protein n=1 Tax=Breoghania sp. TaxID=2065378 RepID=UPI00262789A5|nr:ATP-grasp domain-containing protein [Breoghania sp.]MDJ0932305.1 ATP-grasp domain-containing protein [Breoghania sp.]